MNDQQTQVNTDLKAERVQETFGMAPATPATAGRLKAERVQERLRALPGWELVPGGRAIDRIRVFADSGVAEAYAVFVARLARSERQAVSIDLARRAEEVRCCGGGDGEARGRGGLIRVLGVLGGRVL
jgi:pterin-4a-carbinolamine dehydratase